MESIRVFLTAIYLIIWTIIYYIVLSFQVISTDLLWGIKHFWWYTAWLGYFIKLFLYNIQVIVTTVIWWTIDDIRWIINCVCDPFIWSYTLLTYMWDTVFKVFVDQSTSSNHLCLAGHYSVLHHNVVHIQIGSISCIQWLDNLLGCHHLQILFQKGPCFTV